MDTAMVIEDKLGRGFSVAAIEISCNTKNLR